MATPRAVLLDLDGTLLDSNDAHAMSWAQTLEAYGVPVELAHVRELIGEGGDKLLPKLARIEKTSPLGKEIIEACSARFRREFLPHIRPLPGANALLRTLHERGLRLVLATSAGKHDVGPLLSVLDASPMIDAAPSSEGARSKPDGDTLESAIARTGCAPRDCVMIGDTPYDVEAAHRAGVRVIAFRAGGWPDEALRGADEIYDDPADLLAHLDESLLGAATPRPAAA
jgi:HAD superfamily hydrolase (TIGR01509 family)